NEASVNRRAPSLSCSIRRAISYPWSGCCSRTANTASSALPRLIEGFIVAIATLCIVNLYKRESRYPLLTNAAACTLDLAAHCLAVLLREQHSPDRGRGPVR